MVIKKLRWLLLKEMASFKRDFIRKLSFKVSKEFHNLFFLPLFNILGFSTGSEVKNPSANSGDVGLTSESGRSSGEGNGKPLQNSCWGNPMDRGAWQLTSKGSEKTGLSNYRTTI